MYQKTKTQTRNARGKTPLVGVVGDVFYDRQ